jgi:hypothetical protein
MNRRELLKISGAAVYGLAQPLSISAANSPTPASVPQKPTERWGIFEASFQGPATGNSFLDVNLTATFRRQNRIVNVPGFYDGDGVFRVRFMPEDAGEWSFETKSNVAELNMKTGRFDVIAQSKDNHGPVTVTGGRHFCYADGTPYSPFGTTCYAWVHQGEELESITLKTLSTSPFNKMRMCVFPKSFPYNHNEPVYYPFPRDSSGKNDTQVFNPRFFQHLERRIQDLCHLGIEADVILFHPYDRWGYSSLPKEVDDRYVRYVIARLASHRNVWWSLANEYDSVKTKTMADWDRFARIVEEEDPFHHLRSIHYNKQVYDYSKQWATHAGVQSYDFICDFPKAKQWFLDWRKPIIFDEFQYEGNISDRWGNLSPEEMTRRCWLCIISGCYASHGETYADPNDIIWWAKGGTLHGDSSQRIGFLRKIVEECAPIGLRAVDDAYYLSAAAGQETILYYFDYHRPEEYEFKLPPSLSYKAEFIDPWNMTITPAEGTFSGTAKIKLSAKPFQAIRFLKTG